MSRERAPRLSIAELTITVVTVVVALALFVAGLRLMWSAVHN